MTEDSRSNSALLWHRRYSHRNLLLALSHFCTPQSGIYETWNNRTGERPLSKNWNVFFFNLFFCKVSSHDVSSLFRARGTTRATISVYIRARSNATRRDAKSRHRDTGREARDPRPRGEKWHFVFRRSPECAYVFLVCTEKLMRG